MSGTLGEIRVLFVGGGNMATAMIGGLLAQGVGRQAVCVVDPLPEARVALEERFAVRCSAVADVATCAVDVVVLAVKPQQLSLVCGMLRGLLEQQLVISIAAGVRLRDIARWLGGYANLVRAMPNTPALVRAGVTGLFAPAEVTAQARTQAESVLGAIGRCFWVDNENLMDCVTAVSGSGPAYVFYIMEALQEGAMEFGFDAESARLMALETVTGAARLAAAGADDFAKLRQRVTSKGGTTEAALGVMTEMGVAQALRAAMRAALARGRELGAKLGSLDDGGKSGC